MKVQITSFKEAKVKLEEGPSRDQWMKWSIEDRERWLAAHPNSQYKIDTSGPDQGVPDHYAVMWNGNGYKVINMATNQVDGIYDVDERNEAEQRATQLNNS